MNKLHRPLPFHFFFCCIVFVGCSSSGGSTPVATCAEVCTHVTDVCGFSDPSCTSACSSFDSSMRACVAGAASCESAISCGMTTTDDGGTSDMMSAVDAGSDSGRVCDGTKYCADSNTVSYCEGGITRSSPCNGLPCAGGRCGSCTGADDCRGISYRCMCADGTERTGVVDGSCSDSEGSMRWCGHPSIDSSVCGAQGFDPEFGYLATGCVSTVDP